MMKTKEIKRPTNYIAIESDEGSATKHIRRCHLCAAVSETAEDVVTRCQGCGKFLAPFYFFNEAETIPYSDNESRPDPTTPDKLVGERLPLRGFTAVW